MIRDTFLAIDLARVPGASTRGQAISIIRRFEKSKREGDYGCDDCDEYTGLVYVVRHEFLIDGDRWWKVSIHGRTGKRGRNERKNTTNEKRKWMAPMLRYSARYIEPTDKDMPRTRLSKVLIRRSSSLFFHLLIARWSLVARARIRKGTFSPTERTDYSIRRGIDIARRKLFERNAAVKLGESNFAVNCETDRGAFDGKVGIVSSAGW